MKRKTKQRWLAMLMAAVVSVGGISLPPVSAAPSDMAAAAAAEETDARNVNFNKGWKFNLGNVPGAEQKNFDDSAWDDILIPHDFSIFQDFSSQYEAESGFLPGGIGWYRKTFTLPADYADKTLVLNFDGVYNHAYVYVNGTKVGENHYGYNDFAFDISDLVICDGTTENVISVKAENQMFSSRWYSGSGIYRDVVLQVSGNVHVGYNGTYVTTPNLETQQNGNVDVHVETTVQNDRSASAAATVRTTVLDQKGDAVSQPVSNEVTVAAGQSTEVTQSAVVNKPQLWSCENPALYYVQTEILVGGQVLDTYKTEFGFRYFKYDATTGFWLNGQKVKMKGACMHHDQGALGAASYRDAVYRQIEILKGMGCNAIRSSHNSPSDVLISVCNELGVVVMDEIFDGWSNPKNGNDNDFSVYFNRNMTADNQVLGGSADKTWSKFVLESTVNRDKNDPCVVMWSIGNEVDTGCRVDCSSTYPAIADNLISWLQAIDRTRPITHGDNNANITRTEHFKTQIDRKLVESGGICGLNYAPGNYATNHAAQPTWPFVATETVSPANSRGIYSTLGAQNTPGDYQCTAYDTAAVGWGQKARESWYYIIINDWMSGEYIWTGFDYIGEPTGTGPWNGTAQGSVTGGDPIPNSCFFGVIDTAGFPKDSYYYYSSQWLEDRTTLHVVPQSWNEEELVVNGGKVPVYIYSNAAKVELFLNGEKIGTSTRNVNTTDAGYEWATYTNTSNNQTLCTAKNPGAAWDKMAAQFDVKYEPGTLSVKAYDEQGQLIEDTYGMDSVTTSSDAGTSLSVKAEKTEIQADGSSLCYIAVDVMDAQNRMVPAARNNIRFSLSGNGTIVGVDNGNPSSVDKFQVPSVLTSETTANIDAFSGKALVIVRSTEEAGGFVLRAESAGLASDSVQVNTVGDTQGAPYLQSYDLKTEYAVDMGMTPALQTAVTGMLSDGTEVSGTVTWDEVTAEMYNTPGEYQINGSLVMNGETVPVSAFLTVRPDIVAAKNYSRATSAGVVPYLPETVAGILPDGRTYGAYPVVWEQIEESSVQNVGDVAMVNGMATISEGVQYPVTATIRVAEGETLERVNAARTCASLTENCNPVSDNLQAIKDGSYDGSTTQTRWTNWNSHKLLSSPAVTFTWNEVQKVDEVKMWFFTDASVTVPREVEISVSEDGTTFIPVEYTATRFVGNAETTFTLDGAYNAKALRITLTQDGADAYVGLSEVEIWTAAYSYTSNSTAVLDTLSVDGETVDGFVSGEHSETVYEASASIDSAVTAAARDNASVTIVPMDDNSVVHIVVTSEDNRTTNVYAVKLNGAVPMPDAALLQQFAAAIQDAEGKQESEYTANSWSALKSALDAAKALDASTATRKQMKNVLQALQTAVDGLVKKGSEPGPIKPIEEKPTLKLIQEAAAEVKKAESMAAGEYTADSWKAYQDALAALKALDTSKVTKKQLQDALEKLRAAQKALVKTAVTPTPDHKLAAPVITKLKAGAGKKVVYVTVTVSKVAGADHYEIYRVTGGKESLVGKTKSGKISLNDKKVTKKSAQYYAIAVSKDGKVKSAKGTPKKITMGKSTSIKSAKRSGKGIRITWKKIRNAKNYAIYRSEKKASGYRRIAKAAKSRTAYVDKNVKKGKTYYYKIAVRSKKQTSLMSKAKKIKR